MKTQGRIFNIQKFSINDGPGIRTTVFFKGCPLQCKWCSNPESQNRYDKLTRDMTDSKYSGKLYTVSQVMDIVLQDLPFYKESGGGMTISGGEPLCQMEFARELADTARANNIHVAMETTGYAEGDKFLEFTEHIDLLLFDFKHIDSDVHKRYTGVDNKIIMKNLFDAIKSGREVAVRIPVIPGFNDSVETAGEMADKLMKIGAKTVHLLPFHQFGESKYDMLGVKYEYTGLKQLYKEDLLDYKREFDLRGLECSFK